MKFYVSALVCVIIEVILQNARCNNKECRIVFNFSCMCSRKLCKCCYWLGCVCVSEYRNLRTAELLFIKFRNMICCWRPMYSYTTAYIWTLSQWVLYSPACKMTDPLCTLRLRRQDDNLLCFSERCIFLLSSEFSVVYHLHSQDIGMKRLILN